MTWYGLGKRVQHILYCSLVITLGFDSIHATSAISPHFFNCASRTLNPNSFFANVHFGLPFVPSFSAGNLGYAP